MSQKCFPNCPGASQHCLPHLTHTSTCQFISRDFKTWSWSEKGNNLRENMMRIRSVSRSSVAALNPCATLWTFLSFYFSFCNFACDNIIILYSSILYSFRLWLFCLPWPSARQKSVCLRVDEQWPTTETALVLYLLNRAREIALPLSLPCLFLCLSSFSLPPPSISLLFSYLVF